MRLLILATCALAVLRCSSVDARVDRFEITLREPFADGAEFGTVGAYERIRGKIHYSLDPELVQNQAIVDLQNAPRNDAGRVTFSSDFFMLRPVDIQRGNGAVLYDVNNRGNLLALRFFNRNAAGSNDPSTLAHAGNGFLMRQGYTVVWSGWDGELLAGNNRLRLFAPSARNKDGSIVGPVRYEFKVSKAEQSVNINGAGHGAYRPADKRNARLTRRKRPGDERELVVADSYEFVVEPAKTDGELVEVKLKMTGGVQPEYLYELVYQAQDPLVHGVCFAAVRDLMVAFKEGQGEANPLLAGDQPGVNRTFGFGVSQSGRFLREFLYSGFNESEESRLAFDGLIPHVAGGGLGSFNHRFATPTAYATQHQHQDSATDRFPFTYVWQKDPISGEEQGILDRAAASQTVPLIMHTQSSAEYWSRSGSLAHTDPMGRTDATIPGAVRIYALGGTQHGPAGYPPSKGEGQNLANPGNYRPLLRALLTALDHWVTKGGPPPPSLFPRIRDRTLVDWQQAGTGFPKIPGVEYPQVIQQPSLLDFGPRWRDEKIIDLLPPRKGADYRVLAARCDQDGNVLGCLLPPEVAVPTATYTGWNLYSPTKGPNGELVRLQGSYIPFPLTKQDRLDHKDPRRSLEERYGNLDNYLDQLREECQQMVRQRYLLAEDVEPTIEMQRKRLADAGFSQE